MEGSYQLFPLRDIDEFKELIQTHKTLSGLNVTIPYKEKIIPYLNYISPDALEIGAVNVIKIIREDPNRIKLCGYNSDWIGFGKSLYPLLNSASSCKDSYSNNNSGSQLSALILGTGGAAQAAAYYLRHIGVKSTFVSRQPEKVKEDFSMRLQADIISYSELSDACILAHELIVNATPIGMAPDVNNCPKIPYDSITSRHIAFDVIYNPEETQFLKKCRQKGATTKNGLEMLHRQADAAWNLWIGKV